MSLFWSATPFFRFNPFCFFLLGLLNRKVYATPFDSTGELKIRISTSVLFLITVDPKLGDDYTCDAVEFGPPPLYTVLLPSSGSVLDRSIRTLAEDGCNI